MNCENCGNEEENTMKLAGAEICAGCMHKALLMLGSPYKEKTPKGVARMATGYKSQITINGKAMHLGMFDTPEEAHQAYLEQRKKHPYVHPHKGKKLEALSKS